MSGKDENASVTQAAYPLFERWLDLGEAEREAFLESVRHERADVFARLSALIRADRIAHETAFMTGRVIDDARTAGQSEMPDRSGEVIGNWTLLRALGSGGMGQVWLAQRSDGLHRGHAAIKMLRVPVADGPASRRFAREGRILARLVHPHIAMLLDAGVSTGGERYLVIEFVDGQRIDAWCDARRLGVDERLKLFLQVCDAVSHAHASLVIHRDLKPSNILVMAGGDAKLLDFGIASLVQGDAEDAAHLTGEFGSALTPAYAAPEQVEGGSITTATDVYALGAVLHVLLGGHGPFDTSSTPLGLARAVVEAPPRRLSDLGDANSARQIASARGMSPDRLQRALRGDLEVIVARALKKSPAERYASAEALADDVRRHLDHLPIAARRDSTIYRALKFLRRHWIGVSATAAIIIAICAGMALAVWQANRAEREAARAVAVKQFLLDMFGQARTDTQSKGLQVRETTINDMLTAGADHIEKSFANEPEIRDEVFEILTALYSDSFEPAVAIALARRRFADATAAFGADDARRIPAEIGLANALITSGEDSESATLLAHAQTVLDHNGDRTSLSRARLLRWQGILVMVHREKPSWSDHPLRRSVELLHARFPDDEELIETLVTLPSEACRYGRVGEAVDAADELSKLSVSRYGPDNIYVDTAVLLHGQLLVATGTASAASQAIPLLEKARDGYARHLGEKNQNVVLAQLDLAEAYWLAGRQGDSRNVFAHAEQIAARDHAGETQVDAMLTATRESLAKLAGGKGLHRCEAQP